MIYSTTGHRDFYAENVNTPIEDFLLTSDIDLMLIGGAGGWDTYLAQKCRNFYIPYTLVLPYRGFNGSNAETSILSNLMKSAIQTIYLADEYYKDCFKVRNQYLVDNSDILLTYYDEKNKEASGTGQTVRMARNNKLPIINIFKKD